MLVSIKKKILKNPTFPKSVLALQSPFISTWITSNRNDTKISAMFVLSAVAWGEEHPLQWVLYRFDQSRFLSLVFFFWLQPRLLQSAPGGFHLCVSCTFFFFNSQDVRCDHDIVVVIYSPWYLVKSHCIATSHGAWIIWRRTRAQTHVERKWHIRDSADVRKLQEF